MQPGARVRVCVWQSFAGPKANVLMKVFADQTVWSMFLNAGYTTVVLCVPSAIGSSQ
jgi:hypothetical protein